MPNDEVVGALHGDSNALKTLDEQVLTAEHAPNSGHASGFLVDAYAPDLMSSAVSGELVLKMLDDRYEVPEQSWRDAISITIRPAGDTAATVTVLAEGPCGSPNQLYEA